MTDASLLALAMGAIVVVPLVVELAHLGRDAWRWRKGS